ncbi:MAG: hypothetical protein HYU41_27460 [Candidatus Rokubacteria bacterium]|nr:hypothetical protein [Candidatus Rokubacteria bacterium]
MTTAPAAMPRVTAPFALCAICGAVLAARDGICEPHLAISDAGWAERNRLMCDLLHRGKCPASEPRIA